MDKETATISYVYETLDPLEFSGGEQYSDASRSYSVYRTEISASSDLIVDIPVSDYFSLDLSDVSPHGSVDHSLPLQTVFTASSPCSPEEAPLITSESTWFRAGSKFRSPMLQLHKEILDFSEFVAPTPEEQLKRATAVDRVFQVVKYIWPHCRVEVFGSFKTGLYLPTSDIDVVILDTRVNTPQTGLYALSRALSQKGIAKKMQVIAKARVPIAKFVEKQSGIAFDISFDMDSGPKAANFIKDVVEKIPPLRHLCLVLKVFLQQRELNEVYSGGIGSYALLTMLITHLQMHWRSDMHGYQKSMEHNLGILLVKFFEFYGRRLNTHDVGISCNSSSTFFLKRDRGFCRFLNTEKPYLLSIEDPQAPDNDIGRNSFNYFKVKSAFAMAFSCLTDARVIKSLGSQKSILGTIIRPDPALLDRRGGCNGQLTFDSLLPGAGNSAAQEPGFDSDIIYNWKLSDDEPFPRDGVPLDNVSLSSRKRGTKYEHGKFKKMQARDLNGCAKKEKRGDRDFCGQRSFPHSFR